MCLLPDTPKAPPPLPVQAPPVVPVLDQSAQSQATKDVSAGRARSGLRIDKTANVPGAAGSGLNIPS